MEGPFGADGFCGLHHAQLAGFQASYLPTFRVAFERRPEAVPVLQAILQAADDCPECRRRFGPGSAHRILLPAGTTDAWPDAFLQVSCTRSGSGPWACTYEASVKRKALLLGDASSGKTDLVRSAVYDEVSDAARDALGAKVMSRHQTVRPEGEGVDFHVTFSVWDVTGHRIADKRRLRAYFQGAATVLAACDLSEETSVRELGYWLTVAERILGRPTEIIVAQEPEAPDPSGIAEARLAGLAREHRAVVVRVPRKDPHVMEHVFEGLGVDAIREVFGTQWHPRMYA